LAADTVSLSGLCVCCFFFLLSVVFLSGPAFAFGVIDCKHNLGVLKKKTHSPPSPSRQPENLLLDAAFGLKLADFGSAALHTDPDTLCATECGTRSYMSPEVRRDFVTFVSWAWRALPFC
jgi:serine/threonine protein kinase